MKEYYKYQARNSPPGIGGEWQNSEAGLPKPEAARVLFVSKKNRNRKKMTQIPSKKKASAVPRARLQLFF